MNTESKHILKKSAGSLFTAGLAVCLGSALSIIYLECIRLLADSVLTQNVSRIWGIFTVFAVSLMLSALLLCVKNSKALTLQQKLIESLEQKSIDIWLGLNYKNKENTEKMLPILRNDIFTYAEQLSGFILKTIGIVVSVILTGVYVIMIEPWLFALTLILSLAAISISAYRGRKLSEQNEKLYFHMGAIYNHNAELVRNREAAYVLNGERVVQPYQKEIADYKNDQIKILGTMTMQRILGSANTILNTCVILIIGGYGVSTGRITISDLIVLLAAVGFLTNTLYQIPVCISEYQQLKGMDSRINALLTPQAEVASGFEDRLEEVEKITSISVQNVSFAYENGGNALHGGKTLHEREEFQGEKTLYGREEFQGEKLSMEERNSKGEKFSMEGKVFQGDNLFEGININLKSGECLILKGASGSGKSTLLKIFADILKGYSGTILCGGKDLKNIKESAYWDRILYLSQEPQLISGTVKENITMFKAAAERKLHDALEQAGLQNLISEFPEGIDTPVSMLNLSSGEQQRICLARAFYGEYDLILCDESFSAIDPDSRREIFGKFLAQLKEKSQILILSSHTDFAYHSQGDVKVLIMGESTKVMVS